MVDNGTFGVDNLQARLQLLGHMPQLGYATGAVVHLNHGNGTRWQNEVSTSLFALDAKTLTEVGLLI